MPRSSPLRAGFLWPAEQICTCLLAEGLGRDIQRCLVRTRPVPRARIAATGQRPNPPEHYDSTDVRVPGIHPPPQRMTLVDDVITRGSTFMGMVPRLQAAYPEVTIVCFALVRTVSMGEVETDSGPDGRDDHLPGGAAGASALRVARDSVGEFPTSNNMPCRAS